jgi:predicted XRE-type DNA-binding protein
MLAGWSLAAHLRGKGVLSFNYAVFKVLCKPNASAIQIADIAKALQLKSREINNLNIAMKEGSVSETLVLHELVSLYLDRTNLSQKQIATRLGITQDKLKDLRTGVRFPSSDDIENIIQMFNLNYEQSNKLFSAEPGLSLPANVFVFALRGAGLSDGQITELTRRGVQGVRLFTEASVTLTLIFIFAIVSIVVYRTAKYGTINIPGITLTETPTPTSTATPTVTPTLTPTSTLTPTWTPTLRPENTQIPNSTEQPPESTILTSPTSPMLVFDPTPAPLKEAADLGIPGTGGAEFTPTPVRVAAEVKTKLPATGGSSSTIYLGMTIMTIVVAVLLGVGLWWSRNQKREGK